VVATSTSLPQPPQYPLLGEQHLKTPQRRLALPVVLFLVTCLSTFWAGTMHWISFAPQIPQLDYGTTVRWTVLVNWRDGLVYMAAMLAILLTHEMGHFVATLWYRIPASLPFFIPFLPPIGTMGAVIGMAGYRANRRQIFDIGVAGPLAGLAVAIPILFLGVQRLDLAAPARGGLAFDCPWLLRILLQVFRPGIEEVDQIWVSQLNPCLMAAWVGLLITGLNMLPVSQLDGGHIIYALLLTKGRWIARGFLMVAIAYVVITEAYMWSLMIILVTIMGTDHPPTADDRVPLGWFRMALGYASLTIPLLCFPPQGLIHKM
jgi:Zn-dependent protease